MPRPADFTCAMIGLVKAPSSRRKPIAPPKTDPLWTIAQLVRSASGVMFERTPGLSLTRPAREKFPPGPEGDALFEAHLDALGERIRAGERNCASTIKRVSGPKDKQPILCFRGRGSVSWLDLKTLRCAGCRVLLLGPSQEPLRAVATPATAKRLPPPVAGRISDRPVCGRCLAEQVAVA